MPRKILIVDDNVINRQLLIKVLHKDYDIIEAADGKEALAVIHHNYKMLSAVLLDIVMPEMDGYEVLRRMKENAPLSQIPVIMVTASDDENARVNALSLGANDFILKPFNPEIVRHCLRNCIALRETASILNAIQKDKLTGLFNRETFFDKATSMIKRQEPGYYILSSFDIDNFKLINDQYGAAEGDRILKEIGTALKSNMEKIGGLAGRISADNFAALFPAENSNTDVLQKIMNKELVVLEQQPMVFSVGRYLITDTMLPASTVYDRAYIAKQSVKGRFDKHLAYFDNEMLEKLVRDQQIVGEMETALEKHQFEVWFQPQYNHVTGKIIGAEALVRWRHPEKGIVPPGEFIPLFEQNGFIYELDKYVWRESCRLLRKWIDENRAILPVSVNISRYDIFRADLIEVINGFVKEFNIPINLLRLEITESAFAKTTNLIVHIVKQLVDLGFTVEIDDFGSGYSSLNTLKSVPAQILKLDMRFLEDADDSQRGGNILASIVRMTKWLGMAVIAEGVETKEQGDFLKSIGCCLVQGYLYARPMPASDYEALLPDSVSDESISVLETVDNLDNNLFWNPQSMDTLIFNSYVGSACIFEYHKGTLELLRATDKYANMFGKITVAELLRLNLMEYMDAKARAEAVRKLNDAVINRNEITVEFLFTDVPGCAPEIYIRSVMRIIAAAGERYLIYCISENITELRISERKERQLTKQLKVVMDNVNCGITAVTFNNDSVNYLLANDKYYDLLGYTRTQYKKEIGNAAFVSIFPDDRERVARVIENTKSSRIPTSMEYRALRRDGSIIWLRSFLSMTSFEDINDEVQLCTYADITTEKNTAQNLLDNLPCGAGICMISDSNAYMTYLNKRYYSYFKHNTRHENTASVFEAIHPDDRALLRNTMRPALKKGGEGTCVVRIMDGCGEYLTFRLTGVAIETSSCENAIYVTFVPISDEELSIGEMLNVALAAVMSSSSDISFVKDKNLKYICCSREFAKMTGLESERDIFGKTDYDLFDKELADSYVMDDKALMDSKKSIVDTIIRIPTGDDQKRFSRASKFLLYDSSGNIVGVYGTGRDVTQEREEKSRRRFLIDSIPGGIAVYSGRCDRIQDIQLTYFSDGFCRLFGYTREELEKLGKNKLMSLVAEEFIPESTRQIRNLINDDIPLDNIYRAITKDGSSCWIHAKAVIGERNGNNLTVNAVFFDITKRQNALENLRISEEENRLAIKHSKNVVCRYDIASKSLKVSSNANAIFEIPAIIKNVPYGQVRNGSVSPETAEAYISFYESILNGDENGYLIYQRKSTLGWRWIEAYSSTIFSSNGKPISAVISFNDVTESFEKDAAYKKWMQSLHIKSPEAYSLFRCNISKKTVYDTREGTLLNIDFKTGPFRFNEHTAEYVKQHVWNEDAEGFLAFLNTDYLLKKYVRGERTLSLEYREIVTQDSYRWLRLSVDLVEYPHSSDVEAYLLFENIDEEKRAELLKLETMQTDILTGVLNRSAFEEKVNTIISDAPSAVCHALLMMDIDGFKQVNDVFGHTTGDRELVEIANLLHSLLRSEDLVGRLGGDEFVIFLKDISDAKIAAGIARRICTHSRKAFSAEVQISGSIGIALYPQDGNSFEALYEKADQALYFVKGTGRDNFAFYRDDMNFEHLKPEPDTLETTADKKRRMLIVDDSRIDYEMLANIFRDSFVIEKARDGNSALIRMRHYGSAISVVLLDLMMPGMDGFTVLEKMQQSPEMRSVPVIVVSGDDSRETGLRAIRAGASDFVIKPVDPDVLRIRVNSAVSKSENDRLRIKNRLLKLQSKESEYYKSLLDDMGMFIIETDYEQEHFVYSTSTQKQLAGKYDERPLWDILLCDSVAEPETVNDMQTLVRDIAFDESRTNGNMNVTLLSSDGTERQYRLNVCKLPEKLVLSLMEI